MPELQGRLPIRVELKPLTRDDFRRILTEPEASLIKQYIALMATEGVTLEFSEDAIDAVADVAVAVNSSVENIGARRLQTVMERVLDDVSFAAPDRSGDTVKIDAGYVQEHVGELPVTDDSGQQEQVGLTVPVVVEPDDRAAEPRPHRLAELTRRAGLVVGRGRPPRDRANCALKPKSTGPAPNERDLKPCMTPRSPVGWAVRMLKLGGHDQN